MDDQSIVSTLIWPIVTWPIINCIFSRQRAFQFGMFGLVSMAISFILSYPMITLTEYTSTSPDNTSCVIKWPDSNQSYIEIDPFQTLDCSTGCTPNETLYHTVLFIALFIIPFISLRLGFPMMNFKASYWLDKGGFNDFDIPLTATS